MKVLIATPIHVSKDYSMQKWLENVSKMDYPADLLLVDNSPDLSYIKRVKDYCQKYALHPQIKHLKISQQPETDANKDELTHERIVRSEEVIRHEFLAG